MNLKKSGKSNKALVYIVLWTAGFMVAGAILFLWNNSDRRDDMIIFTNLEVAEAKKLKNNIVDDLLLSANELKIHGKSSIIEFSFKDKGSTDEVLIEQIKTNPKNAYKTILRNKIDKLKNPKKPISDFNIKPVPR